MDNASFLNIKTKNNLFLPKHYECRPTSCIAESSVTEGEDKQPKCSKAEHREAYICNCWIIKAEIVFLADYTTSNTFLLIC